MITPTTTLGDGLIGGLPSTKSFRSDPSACRLWLDDWGPPDLDDCAPGDRASAARRADLLWAPAQSTVLGDGKTAGQIFVKRRIQGMTAQPA